MVSIATFRSLALSFPETTEEPHFEKISFRVRKKIFATFDEVKNTASLKLSGPDQDIFSLVDLSIIYPVANKWGQQGWTTVEMKKVKKQLFMEALSAAYCEVVPKSSTK